MIELDFSKDGDSHTILVNPGYLQFASVRRENKYPIADKGDPIEYVYTVRLSFVNQQDITVSVDNIEDCKQVTEKIKAGVIK